MNANKDLIDRDFAKLKEDIRNNPESFINWAEANYPHLPKIAESEESTAKYLEESKKNAPKNQFIFKKVVETFIPDSKSLYGDNSASKVVKENAEATASTIGIANGINVITAAPLLWFSFSNIGIYLGLPLFITVLIGILGFSNNLGSAVASKRPENKKWSTSSAFGLVAINILLSGLSVFGTSLLLGQADLAQNKAEKIFSAKLETVIEGASEAKQEKEKYENQIEGKLEEVKTSIEENITNLNKDIEDYNEQIKQKEKLKDSIIASAGTYDRGFYLQELDKVNQQIDEIDEKKKSTIEQRDNLLESLRTNAFLDSDSTQYNQIQQDIKDIEDKIKTLDKKIIYSESLQDYSSQPVAYLYNCMPDVFYREFKLLDSIKEDAPNCLLSQENPELSSDNKKMSPPSDFAIKSGLTATEEAFVQFFETLEKGEWAKLGFPLFFLLLSTVTSIAALVMAFKFSESDDVRESWDETYQEEKTALIVAAIESLDKKPNLN